VTHFVNLYTRLLNERFALGVPARIPGLLLVVGLRNSYFQISSSDPEL